LLRIILSLVTALLVSICHASGKQVNVIKVSTLQLYDTYSYPTSVIAIHDNSMYAETSGFVSELNVKLGQSVTRGQKLVVLNSLQPGYSAKEISSQIDGQVAALDLRLGQQVKPGDLLIRVLNPDILTLQLELPEDEYPFLKQNTKGTIKFRSIETQIPVVITGMAPNIKSNTGTITTTLNFVEDSSLITNAISTQILPGMVGIVTFKVPKHKGISIPLNGIYREAGKMVAKLVVANKVVTQELQLGRKSFDGTQEVISGLNDGDIIIVGSSQLLLDGEEVSYKK